MSHHHTPERLLKWYDFRASSPALPTAISFPASSTVAPATIATITLQKINADDRQNLEATIQWTASATFTPATTGTAFVLEAFQQATFQIYRDMVGGPLVAQFTDTGLLGATGTTGTAGTAQTVPLSSVTTTITATDTGVTTGRTHNYVLAVTIPATNVSGVVAIPAAAFPAPGATGAPVVGTPVVTAYHFAGSVIDENNT